MTGNHITCYPNPVQDELNVFHPGTRAASIQVVDMSGRVVLHKQVAKNVTQTKIDVHVLRRGVYKLVWINGKDEQGYTILVE